MQGRELLVAVANGQRLRRLDETARTLGVFLNIHRLLPQPAAPPTNDTEPASSLGPPPALTFVNRRAAHVWTGLRVFEAFRILRNIGMRGWNSPFGLRISTPPRHLSGVVRYAATCLDRIC